MRVKAVAALLLAVVGMARCGRVAEPSRAMPTRPGRCYGWATGRLDPNEHAIERVAEHRNLVRSRRARGAHGIILIVCDGVCQIDKLDDWRGNRTLCEPGHQQGRPQVELSNPQPAGGVLFGAQRQKGVDLRRAPRREQTRDERDAGE